MGEKRKGFTRLQRVLACALTLVLCVTLLPLDGLKGFTAETGSGTTVDDPHTLVRPTDVYQGTTYNAGKILVGKSVTDGINDANGAVEPLDLSAEMSNMPAGTYVAKDWTPDKNAFGDNNFLVTISQASQMYGISSDIPVPMDVVFVLDTSGSMDTLTSSGHDRADDVMDAANAAIASILAMNEHNRIAVVGFSETASTLSALRHYSGDAASSHLTKSWGGGTIYGRNANGNTGTGRNIHLGGTNVQAGIVHGAKILNGVAADDTYVMLDTDGDGVAAEKVTRMPILVVLSDGAATYADTRAEWWNAQSDNFGNGKLAQPGYGFLAALSAAYYKDQITEHYYGADSTGSASIYTIGIGLGTIRNGTAQGGTGTTADECALAHWTMDPSAWLGKTVDGSDFDTIFNGYWTSYQRAARNNQGSFSFTAQSNTFNFRNYTGYGVTDNVKEEVTDLRYNDAYWAATNTEEINAAFKELVIEIQKRAITAPTLTDRTVGEALSGYVSFTDSIGEYMEVKGVVGITGGGYLYRGKSFAERIEHYGEGGEEQETFDAVLRTAMMERMSLASSSGTAISEEIVDQILKVATLKAGESLTVTNAGGGSRVFDGATYGRQLYYNSAEDYSNSFTWFGKIYYPTDGYGDHDEDYAVEFLGVAPRNADSIEWITAEENQRTIEAARAAVGEGELVVVRSYFIYGGAGGVSNDNSGDYLYFQLRTIRSLTGPTYQQTVNIAAPANLLAMQRVLINDTNPNNLEAHYDALIPTRVTYEVGLRSDITRENVWSVIGGDYARFAENIDADGTLHFYTNDFTREGEPVQGTQHEDSDFRALAHATFDAANSNSYYRYEVDTPLLDARGNQIRATTALNSNTTYYYNRTYYTWNTEADGISRAAQNNALIGITIPAEALGNNADGTIIQKGGYWYIAKGTYTSHNLTSGDDTVKSVNETGTAPRIVHPERTAEATNSHYTVWLGNNGRYSFKPVQPKTVYDVDDTSTEIDGTAVTVGEELQYRIQTTNGFVDAADVTIDDTIPTGTALKEGSIWTKVGGKTFVHKTTDGTTAGTKTTWTIADGTGENAINGTVIYDSDSGKIKWALTDVKPGVTVVAGFEVAVTEAAITVGAVLNSAEIAVGENVYTTNITTNPVIGKEALAADGAPLPADGVKVGDAIEYAISYVNTTTEMATVTITDTLSTGLSYVAGSASHTPAIDGQKLTWTITNVAPGAGGVVSFEAVVGADAVQGSDGDGTTAPDVQNQASIRIGNDPDVTYTTNPAITPVDTGDLVLKKVLNNSDTQKAFTLELTESTAKLTGSFAYTLNGTPVSGKTINFTNGRASVAIKGGETITILELPVGVIISVVEHDPGSGFAAAMVPASGVVTISADATAPASVTVTNTYTAQPTNISTAFSLSKALISPVELLARSFTFVAQATDANGNILTGNAAETLTTNAVLASNETAANIVFNRPFTTAGTWYYVVSEQAGSLEGITYDPAKYLVTVTVTDNGEGQLEVSSTVKKQDGAGWVVAGSDTVLPFTNTYKPAATTASFEGAKTLSGRALINGEFRFVVDEMTDGSATATVKTSGVAYGTNDAAGNILFDAITYDKTGTYYYRITESTATGQAHVEFDPAVKRATVTVTNDNGVLKADVAYEGGGVAFANTYETQDVSVTPTGTKSITNGGAGSYSFAVYEWDPVENKKLSETPASTGTATVDAATASANIAFSPIPYSLNTFTNRATADSITLTYMVEEVIPTVGADLQLDYDRSRYTFEVELSFNAQSGVLSADGPKNWKRITDRDGDALATVVNAVTAAFENLYSPPLPVVPGEVQQFPELKKTVTNKTGAIPAGLTFGFQIIKAAEAVDPAGNASTMNDNVLWKVGDVVGSATSVATQETAADATTGSATATTGLKTSALTFRQAGKYYAWLVENNAGNEVHGVKHDNAVYLMVFDITADDTGKLSASITYYSTNLSGSALLAAPAEKRDMAAYAVDSNKIASSQGSAVSFANEFSAAGTMTISAAKDLVNENSNRPLTAGMFNFTLTEKGGSGTIHNGTNDANGKIVFDTLTFAYDGFDNAGKKTLTYTMKETPGVLEGITYDKSEYEITVELTYDSASTPAITGKVVKIVRTVNAAGAAASETVYDATAQGAVEDAAIAGGVVGTVADNNPNEDIRAGAVFVNTARNYQGASVTIPLSKKLTGRDMAANEFSFSLTHVKTNGQPVTPTVVATVNSGAAKDGVLNELTNAFTRTYGVTVQPGTTVEYLLTENGGNRGGVTYDRSAYRILVSITDVDSNGALEATVTSVTKVRDAQGNDVEVDCTAAGITFANTYAAASVSMPITGTKILHGRDMNAGDFSFVVELMGPSGSLGAVSSGHIKTLTAEGESAAITFDPVTFYEAGTYTLRITEVGGTLSNMTYSKAVYMMEVIVTDDVQGNLVAAVSSFKQVKDDADADTDITVTSADFTNTYTPNEIPVHLELSKALNGRALAANEFGFTVTETKFIDASSTEMSGRGVVAYGSNTADGKITFSSFTVKAEGIYEFAITENATSRPGVTVDPKTIVATVNVAKDAAGVLSISSVTYADTDNVTGNDTTFTNTYEPIPAKMPISATKTLSGVTGGMDLNTIQFSFTAALQKKGTSGYAAVQNNGADVVITGKNTGGLVSFDEYTFTEAGEYRWVITEVDSVDPAITTNGTMTFDPSVFHAYITVTDDPDTGKLSAGTPVYKKVNGTTEDPATIAAFTNTFDPTDVPVKLEVIAGMTSTKVLNGREMTADDVFGFEVRPYYGGAMGNVIATATAKLDPNATDKSSAALVFDYNGAEAGLGDGLVFSAPGIWYYTITETDHTMANVDKDDARWIVRVSVTQTAEGKLEAATAITMVENSSADITNGIVFTNEYKPDATEVVLNGWKNLTNRPVKAGEFLFNIVDGQGNLVSSGTTAEGGKITFNKMLFDAQGLYEYTIVEVDNNLPGVQYDRKTYALVINVTDDPAEGKLKAAVTIDGTAYDAAKAATADAQIVFSNEYYGSPTSATFTVGKALTGGKILEADAFEFALARVSGTAAATAANVKNDANGDVTFHVTGLSAVGEYVFRMTEIAGTDPEIRYDGAEILVKINVVDDLAGSLQVDSIAFADANGAALTAPVFTNAYEPKALITPVELSATKTLVGRALADQEFRFTVKDTFGNELATGTNDAAGKVTFTNFERPIGSHQLVITEVDTGIKGVTYDTITYVVTMDVERKAPTEALTVTVHYPADGIVFNNAYVEEEPETPVPPVPPTPDTRDSSRPGLWLSVMALSMACMAACIIMMRRQRYGK